MISLFIFLLGLAAGSFLNAVIYRLEKGESALRGRSYCPHCKHELAWRDLIPVLSFLILRGRCRSCGEKISWQYPAVEIFTAFIFLLIFNSQFSSFNQVLNFQIFKVFYLFAAASLLIVIFVYDLKYYLISDKILFSAILISCIWYLVSRIFFHFYPGYEILHIVYSAFGASAFFLAIFLVSRGRWMGFGDVKLAFFMGLFLGWPNILVALFVAFLLGAIIGIGLIVLKKKGLKSEVPFGPFLVTGTFIALFWGEYMVTWYWNLFSV